jgi:mechanosensitive ion channel-like protein
MDLWSDLVWRAVHSVISQLITILPGILAMVTLTTLGLGIGWVMGRLARRLASTVAFDRRAEAWGLRRAMGRSGIRRTPSDVFGLAVFWTIFLVSVALAVDALAIPGTGRVTDFILSAVPRVLGAGLILLVGWLASNFLAEGALIAAVNAHLPEARLLARAIRWAVLLFTTATAITHLGIGKEMVLVAFGITFGGLVLTLSLAFGLGGRRLARQVLDRHLRREPHPSETFTHL